MISLDMTQKTKTIEIPITGFGLENGIITLQIEVSSYDLTGKTITAGFSPAAVESTILEVIDNVIQLPIYSSEIRYGVNHIQLNFRWDSDKLEQSPIMIWKIEKSLFVAEPAKIKVDIITDLIAQYNNIKNDYGKAEANRDALYSAAEGVRNGYYNDVEIERNNSYDAAEVARDDFYEVAEANRNTKVNELGEQINNLDAQKAEQTDLDITNANMALKASTTYVDTKITESQKMTINYEGTLAELIADVTVDTTKNYLILDATDTVNYGYVCYHNDTTWVAGWKYQNYGIAIESIETKELANKSVSIEKTNFISKSINHFNKNTVTPNKSIVSGTGAIVDNASYSVSDFIQVFENTQYTIWGSHRVAFYKKDLTVISTQDLSYQINSTFTTPINTQYIRCTAYMGYLSAIQLNLGATLLPFEPYGIKIDALNLEKLEIKADMLLKNFDGWKPSAYCKIGVVDDICSITALGGSISIGATYTTNLAIANKRIYFSALVMTDSITATNMGIRIKGTDFVGEIVIDSIVPTANEWYELKGIFTATTQTGNVIFDIFQTNVVGSDVTGKSIFVKEIGTYGIDLTELSTDNYEPTLEDVEKVIKDLPNGLNVNDISLYNLKNIISINNNNSNKFSVEFDSVEIPSEINTFTAKRLMLIGTKQDNYYNAKNLPIKIPQDIGYLYLDESTNKLYYSSGKYDNPVYLCDWNTALAGGTNCSAWLPIITKDGDIIFLQATPTGRAQPIIYPAGNYSNPAIIATTELYPPSGLTTGTGACISCYGDFFIFGEYMANGNTLQNGEPMRIWKVTKPYSNPANWKVVDIWYYSSTGTPWGQNPTREITHFHTITFDFYTGNWYANTGDLDAHCRVLKSIDDGETWSEIISNGQMWRTLGYIFTEDACYWGTDSPSDYHKLYKAPRDINGEVDFANTVILTQLEITGQRTYNTCLIREPYGLLMLDRAEPRTDGLFDIQFWDFIDEKLYNIGQVTNYWDNHIAHERYGFGNLAATYYQSFQEDGIICGGGGTIRQMSLGILGNHPNNPLGITKIKVTRR